VKEEITGRAGTRVADEAILGAADADNSVLDTLVGEGVVARPDLGGDTGDVRRSHGGSGDGVGTIGGTDPASSDTGSRGEDLAARAEGREGGASVSLVGRHDGKGEGSRGRGEIAGVVVAIASSDSHHEAGAEGVVSGIVDTLVKTTTEGHVANHATTSASHVGGEVNTSNDTSEGARAVGAEDLNTNQVGFLG